MVLLFSFGMCLFSGCGTEKEGKRGKDLDYTVVPTVHERRDHGRERDILCAGQ